MGRVSKRPFFFCLIMIGKAEYLTWGEDAEEDRENGEK
jgi:hypothetical protein